MAGSGAKNKLHGDTSHILLLQTQEIKIQEADLKLAASQKDRAAEVSVQSYLAMYSMSPIVIQGGLQLHSMKLN